MKQQETKEEKTFRLEDVVGDRHKKEAPCFSETYLSGLRDLCLMIVEGWVNNNAPKEIKAVLDAYYEIDLGLYRGTEYGNHQDARNVARAIQAIEVVKGDIDPRDNFS